MGSRVALCTIASVLVVAIIMVAGFGTKKVAKELNGQSLINSRGTDENVVELLRIHCRLELMRANEVVQDVNFHVPEEEMSSRNEITWNSRVLAELDTERLMQALQLKVEHTLVDCLRNRNLLFPFSGEDKVTSSWSTWFLNYVYASPTRRRLSQSSGGAAVQSPAAAPTPAPSSNGVLSPRSTPSPPSGSFFPHDITDTQPTASEQFLSGPNSSSDLPSHKQKSSGKTVIIAVVVTAAATFVISAVLFLCCRRVYGAGSGMRRNDERPLLSLSLSDYSVASSQKSFTLNSTTDIEKKTSNQTLDIYLNSHIDSEINMPIGKIAGTAITCTDDSASEKLAIQGMPPLKPPPGRANSSISNVGPGKGAPPATPPPAPAPPRPAAPSAPMPPPLPLRSSAGPRLPSSGPPPPPPPIPFSSKNSGGPRPPAPGPPPPPPPVPSGSKAALQPPAPPSGGVPPARPPLTGLRPPRPSPITDGDDADAPRAKLKPFFWDKVLANPDHSMVWHQIKSGSFQFNEEMIATLFGYSPAGKNKTQSKESSSQEPSNQYIQIIDPKKAQNLSILLRALNVTTEEVVDALQEGNELPSELIQTLLKMAPTTDEELKLRLYSGEVSRLGPAERFLKVLVDIPFAFKRLEALNFMCILQEEETTLKESFSTLEAACNELRKSRLFLKLLEAVLKTGNRMNDGTFRGGAQAFKLDTLLKLADVKGVDGKTTLLHFVVQEIIRSEGIRAARVARESASTTSINSDDLLEDSSHDTEEHYRSIGLQVVSGLGNELENVKKAAILDAESLIGTVSKLGHALIKAQDLLKSEMANVDKENGFHQTLRSFVQNAEVDIRWLLEEEKRIMALVKSTGDYFHGNSAKDEGLRLFVIVRDFLIILEKVCKEVKIAPRIPSQPQKKAQTTTEPSQPPQQPPSPDPRGRLFPAIKDRRMEYSSSDDDNP